MVPRCRVGGVLLVCVCVAGGGVLLLGVGGACVSRDASELQ